jgi:hypothetical protein
MLVNLPLYATKGTLARAQPAQCVPRAAMIHSDGIKARDAPRLIRPHGLGRQPRRPRLAASLAASSDDAAQNAQEEMVQPAEPSGPRDDDVLPDSLTDALEAASIATLAAMDRGVERCIVEILLPEFW